MCDQSDLIKRARISPPEDGQAGTTIQMEEEVIMPSELTQQAGIEVQANTSSPQQTTKSKPGKKRKNRKKTCQTSNANGAGNKAMLQELPFASEPSSYDFLVETKLKDSASEPRREKQRPNYFIGFPTGNPEIRLGIQEVQKEILQREPRLKPALIDLRTLHITLLVIKLDEVHCLHDARRALDRSIEKIREANLTDLSLDFEGVDHFRESVVFVQIKDNAEKGKLHQLAEIVRGCFEEMDIIPTDSRFTAHLTLAKLSKDFATMKKVKKIKCEWLTNNGKRSFGTESVKTLQLLSMLKGKDDDGYYHCPYQLPLKENEELSEHSSVDEVMQSIPNVQ